jgi:hypothetical protein
MIQAFVNNFMANKEKLRTEMTKHPENYLELVKWVIAVLDEDEEGRKPDAEKVHVVDDGNYQGTLLFLIPETTYQPSDYWFVKVAYGSCSGCDTLEHIRGYRHGYTPTPDEVNQYLTLMLHVVQGLKILPADEELTIYSTFDPIKAFIEEERAETRAMSDRTAKDASWQPEEARGRREVLNRLAALVRKLEE